jgi:hypothetical protein
VVARHTTSRIRTSARRKAAANLTRRNAAEEMIRMAKGGARNRSGPSADPASIRSAQRGLILTALPSEGYVGEVPAFPLPRIVRWVEVFEDGKKHREVDASVSDWFRDRELEVWAEQWRTPQACAWARESWRWPTIAEFCRLKTVVEVEPDANASLVAQLHRFRDQIGLTPAGLKENGWAIAADQVAAKAAAKKTAAKKTSARDRMKVVQGGGGT